MFHRYRAVREWLLEGGPYQTVTPACYPTLRCTLARVKILLATTGSTGDVQPFYALGRRLLAEGHEVKLATTDN